MQKSFRSLLFGFLLIVSGYSIVYIGSQVRGEEKSPPPAPANASAKKSAAVDLQVVKYSQLAEAVKANRGKVIVIDVWASY